MQNIDLIRKNVRGVEKSFLLKNGDVMECDFEKEKVHFLSKSISFFLESFLASHKDVRKISVVADLYGLIFFNRPYVLGVVTSKDTNFPLLDMVSHKLLLTVEEPIEKAEEAVDEILQRMDAFLK